MKWMLVLVVWYSGNGVAVTKIPMESQTLCKAAAVAIHDKIDGLFLGTKIVCVQAAQ